MAYISPCSELLIPPDDRNELSFNRIWIKLAMIDPGRAPAIDK